MKSVGFAIGASALLHLGLWGVFCQRPPVLAPTETVVPASLEISVLERMPADGLSPAQAGRAPATSGPRVAARHLRAHRPSASGAAAAVFRSSFQPPVQPLPAHEGDQPLGSVAAAGDLPADSSGAADGAQVQTGTSALPEAIDLSPFLARLQAAARQCSGARAGEARVRFCVGQAGEPEQVSLVQSTGDPALDDTAMHCVIPGAAPLPATHRCLVVPLSFRD